MNRKHSLIAATLMGVGMLGATPVYAGTAYSWTFTGCGNGTGNTCASTGTPADISLTAQAYSNNGTDSKLAAAEAELYGGGLGVTHTGESTSSPHHSTDNQSYVDSIVFGFGKSVALTDITMGWIYDQSINNVDLFKVEAPNQGREWSDVDFNYKDADFILLRYTGVGAPTLIGNTYNDLVNGGWELINHYSTTAENTAVAVNPDGKTSSYWLVAADTTLTIAGNPSSALQDQLCKTGNFTGTSKDGLYCSQSMFIKDYFKVASAGAIYTSYTPPDEGGTVPEPGSLALLGLGTFLLARVRSKKLI